MKDPASKLHEELLILRCQAGDEVALEELIARYSPGLRFFLRKLVASADTADDLLQETWFDAYRKINRLAGPGAFSAWIYRIARDKAYRHLRRRTSEHLALDPQCIQSVPAEEEAFTGEDARRVRAALDRLPLEQREILALRFVHAMNYEQIAAVVAVPVGTVRSRIHYAKIALRGKLELKPIREALPP